MEIASWNVHNGCYLMEHTPWMLPHATYTMEGISWSLQHGSCFMELTPLKLPHGTYIIEVT